MAADDKPVAGRLTPAQLAELETELVGRVGGEQAKQQLVREGLGLLEPIANSFLDRGLGFAELVDAGADGLALAAQKFVAGKWDFNTYATWWIRQLILRTIADRLRMIRVPPDLREPISKLVSARRRLIHRLDREPTNKELAEETGIASKKVDRIANMTDNLKNLDRLDLEGS